jgi:alpha-galactosidase
VDSRPTGSGSPPAAIRRWLQQAVLVMGLSGLLVLAAGAGAASASGTKAAATPPMGFNSWNAYSCDSNAQALKSVAVFMHNSGLEQDGYKYVNQDGCYTDLEGIDSPNTFGVTAPTKQDPESCGAINGRLPDGHIYVNPYAYPSSRPCANNGVQVVANYVHALGLKLGVYLDASNNWNCEEIPGSYGFDKTDANTLAAWGVDYVKADWGCSDSTVPPASNAPSGYKGIDAPPSGSFSFGGPTFATNPAFEIDDQATQQEMYNALGKALSSVKRKILFSVAGAGTVNSQAWGFQYGAMVRPTGDSNTNFTVATTNKHYAGSLVGIVNAEAQTYEQYTGPGHWIDPDIMEVGNFSATADATAQNEDESEMSLFSELSDPLLMSTNLCPSNCGPDVQPASSAQLSLAKTVFGNRRVIAVDQDRAANPAQVVDSSDPNSLANGGADLVMNKKLADGQYAVTFFNESTTAAATISASAADLGLPSASNYELQDLWSGDVSSSTGSFDVTVAPGQTVMYRIATGTKAPWSPPAAAKVKPAKLKVASIPADKAPVSAKTPNNLVGISCPTTASCETVSAFGDAAALNTANAAKLAFTEIDKRRQLAAISCRTAKQCVAVDLDGYAVRWNPATPRTSTHIYAVDRGLEPSSIACVSATACVVVDGSGYAVEFNPMTGKRIAKHQVDPWIYLAAVACPSATQCTAVGGGGNGGSSEVTFNPASGALSSGGIASNDGSTDNGDSSVSCPSTGQCTAVDGDGNEFTFDPVTETVNAAGLTAIEGDNPAIGSGLGVMTSVACSSGTQCTAVDLSGNAVSFDPTSGTVNSAGVAAIDPSGNGLESVACDSDGGSCTAVDLDGRALTFSPATGKVSELHK